MRRKEAGRQRAHVRPTQDKISLARDGNEWEPTQSPRGRGQQWTNSRGGGCTWACNGAGGDDRRTDGQATVTDRQVWGWGMGGSGRQESPPVPAAAPNTRTSRSGKRFPGRQVPCPTASYRCTVARWIRRFHAVARPGRLPPRRSGR
jgi:hypothetical protein